MNRKYVSKPCKWCSFKATCEDRKLVYLQLNRIPSFDFDVNFQATIKCEKYWQGFKIGDKVLCDVQMFETHIHCSSLTEPEYETTEKGEVETDVKGTIVNKSGMRLVVELDKPIECDAIQGLGDGSGVIKGVKRFPKELKRQKSSK